jgi:hypothetical protein
MWRVTFYVVEVSLRVPGWFPKPLDTLFSGFSLSLFSPPAPSLLSHKRNMLRYFRKTSTFASIDQHHLSQRAKISQD